jgi:hypothetical protein
MPIDTGAHARAHAHLDPGIVKPSSYNTYIPTEKFLVGVVPTSPPRATPAGVVTGGGETAGTYWGWKW